MRRSSGTLTFLVCASALAVVGCGQQASTPTATGTPIGAAASDAEAQAAATAKAAELAAKEQELAEREATLKAQEAAEVTDWLNSAHGLIGGKLTKKLRTELGIG